MDSSEQKKRVLAYTFFWKNHANFAKDNPRVKKNDSHMPVQNSEQVKKVTELGDRYVYLAALRYLNERNLFLQKASVNDKELEVLYTQSRFISYP